MHLRLSDLYEIISPFQLSSNHLNMKIKKSNIAIGLLLLLIFFGYMGFFRKVKNPFFEIYFVKKENLNEIVSVTGKVKPAQEAKLNFEKSGMVVKIFVSVGTQVKKNQLLSQLSSLDLYVELKRAQANLAQAQAQKKNSESLFNFQLTKLAELKRGSRKEEIDIKKSEIEISQQNIQNEYHDTPRVLQYALALTDDAIRNKTTGIFSGSFFSKYTYALNNCSQTEADESERYRFLSENIITDLQEKILKNSLLAEAELDSLLNEFKNHNITFQITLNTINNLLTQDCVINDSTLDSYRANILSAKSSLNTANSSINAKIQNLATFKRQIEKLKRELALMLSGASQEEVKAQEFQVEQARAGILSQEAQISQAEAQVLAAYAQLEKATLRAPFDGIVSRVDVKIGETALPSSNGFSLISENQYEIETFVPEVDIAKLEIGKKAEVTLDAYGDFESFEAVVSSIDPAETVIEGVPTYRVMLNFSNQDEKIKSGMTANVDIITQTRENVLAIPQRAVTVKNGIKTVKILSGENALPVEKEVAIGIVGAGGNVEVLSGLQEGDKIVLYEKEK